jgi:recombinational DNA repair protein RecT
MEGLVRATERAIENGHDNIMCVADSQAALRGILSTAPRSGQYREIRYDTIVRHALVYNMRGTSF